MKLSVLIVTVLVLAGCGSSDGVPEHVERKILKDKEGCSYIGRRGAGDIVYLDFMKEESEETCTFMEDK